MLVISRKAGERIYIGDVEVAVLKVRPHEVQLGFSAPPHVAIHRMEIHQRIHQNEGAGILDGQTHEDSR